MKEDEKSILLEWREVLKEFLDPLNMMNHLPHVFQINSESFERVYSSRKNSHYAIDILIEESLKGDMDFYDFISAIRKCKHEWLATLVGGEIEDDEVERAILLKENIIYVRQFLTLISPHIKDVIIAIDVAKRLTYDGIISKDDNEKIVCEARNYGNRAAVIKLLSILMRKPPRWWERFAHVVAELRYDYDLVDALKSLTFNEKTAQFASDDVSEYDFVKETSARDDTSKPDRGAIPKRKAAMAANLSPSSSHRTKRNTDAQENKTSLRKYQEVLAHDAISGKNVIICAPTGSGKTRVASHIIYTRFNKVLVSQDPKIAFVVPRVALAKQQHDNIKSYLSEDTWLTDYLVGDKKSTLKFALQSSNVIVMTPQILINSLDDDSLHSLKRFSLIIFDECHHTMKETPYNIIMSRYLAMKEKGHKDLPQIIGLTATLGVGKGKLDSAAVDHMLTLCANLDATGGIVTVPLEHQDELNCYTPQPEEENIGLDDNIAKDPFTKMLCNTIDEMVDILFCLNLLKIEGVARPHSLPKGSQQYIQWCQDCLAKANTSLTSKSDTQLCRDVQTCVEYLKLFNGALDLSLKCRPIDAVKFLKVHSERSYDMNLTTTEDLLHVVSRKCTRSLQELQDDPQCANPKLKKMEKEILATFHKDQNSRAMLNVLKRQYAEPIRNWLNESGAMKHLQLKAEYFTGVGKGQDGFTSGLTHNKQEQILDLFRQGVIKVLVCTPEVASEGMDIVDCNLVICYDYVKNEISKTQVKGRARKEGGRMVQFSSRAVMARDKANTSKTLLMEKTTGIVQNMYKQDEHQYLRELKKLQKNAVISIRLKQMLTEEQTGTPKMSNKFKVLCKKCGGQACNSDDIEILNGTMHTFDANTFRNRYKKRPVEHGGTEQKNGLFCIDCDSKWGIFHKFKQIMIPLLSAHVFKFINASDPNSLPLMGKQWSSIKIQFKEVAYLDLAERQTAV